MIAQVVFDLPLEGPFDYLVPDGLRQQIREGMRVKVHFGPKAQTGFVIGLPSHSTVSTLKPIESLLDGSIIFNGHDLAFAKAFCAYYGCSLGEALATMYRNKQDGRPSIHRLCTPKMTIHQCRTQHYGVKIKQIMGGYEAGASFVVLVPDAFKAQALARQLGGGPGFKIGTRSSVFECDGRHHCVMMVDEQDPSFKQEQTPMYETRQVLLERSKIFGFDVSFIGMTPSLELTALALEKNIKLICDDEPLFPPAKVVDLANYKFTPGLLSVPVRNALESALKEGRKGLLILNRRGSYRVTRCVECGGVLKCGRCDSSLIYSRSEGKFLCRHCTYTAPGDTVCPRCLRPSWRSQGIGVEQLQTELKKYFPQARILFFERSTRENSKDAAFFKDGGDFDILISTRAVLRFQGRWRAAMAAFIDFDAELNRLDMRSAFNAFNLALHVSSMSSGPLFIQTRCVGHYVLESLSGGDARKFYDEEMKLRKEFGFSPFKHWIKITWRSKLEKSAVQAASDVYNVLQQGPQGCHVTPPLPDEVGRKRDQFRFNVMVQADEVPPAMAFIKSSLASIKRKSRVITTINVDP